MTKLVALHNIISGNLADDYLARIRRRNRAVGGVS
jgi:hypothetical protein